MQAVSRLFNNFVPEHYTLHLNFEREKRQFSGTVDIRGEILAEESSLTLHSKDLTITAALIDGKTATTSLADDTLILSHPDLTHGTHLITISFEGTITDDMHGLYPCYYEHEGGKKELLATQFESHHAREVFPCIDEPEAKATFDVTLTTESDITVLGNTPIKKQFSEKGRLTTLFHTTPRMSTYLLAWVQGELHKKTALTQGGVEVNIWATKAQQSESMDFALEVATSTIDFLNDYFGVPYPLAKSDHVALPDFTAGAMENWGLITYRERALLVDSTTSLASRQYIGLVIAHELAHQWFGNLVTMRWWDDLWLNESFANLMEYIVIDALYPEWNVWLRFSSVEVISALQRDCIDGVQPVQTTVNHPDEINSLFDPAIVYAKGARLLRMLQHFIGDDAFRSGLRDYFAKHAYKNTEGNDLWRALASSSGQNIEELMNAWITQPGYPVVHITTSAMAIKITQEQFFVGPHNPSSQIWPIPLGAGNQLPALFTTKQEVIATQKATPRLNPDFTAHFISHYEEETLAKIIEDLPTSTPISQLQILYEQQLLARANVISSAALLPLIQAVSTANTDAVWLVIALVMRHLKQFVPPGSPYEAQMKTFAATIAAPLYKQMGWEVTKEESEATTKLRPFVIDLMLYSDDSNVAAKAVELYTTHELTELNPELRPVILDAAVNHTPEAFSGLLEVYRTTTLADLKTSVMRGLIATNNPSRIEQLITLLTDDTFVRRQDLPVWLMFLMRNPYARPTAWQWLRTSWPWITEKFGSSMHYDTFPRNAAATLQTKEELTEYTAFFTPMLGEPALSRMIELGIKDIEGRVSLIESQQKDVEKALIEFNKSR